MRSSLDNISPIDGRYQNQTQHIAKFASEKALIHARIITEITWLETLSQHPEIACSAINPSTKAAFAELKLKLSDAHAQQVKALEQSTMHDVKACEYLLRELVSENGNEELIPWIHFACTSEDINNTAYAIILENLRTKIIVPELVNIVQTLAKLALANQNCHMLGFTHGQAASPTTLGKEIMVFAHRLTPIIKQLAKHQFSAKFNGAVGNHNAHYSAYPKLDWPQIAADMLKKLNLTYNPISTQISNHDNSIAFLSLHKQAMLILHDLAQDFWLYAHKNYITLKTANKQQVGSSTMPHKINPIDFENAEGNIGIYKALCTQLTDKLPISRLQRDLSDSTTLRNIGTTLAHASLAIQNLTKGLEKIAANEQQMQLELEQHWEVLTEAVQTIMRKHGIKDAYEQLKQASQGAQLSADTYAVMLERLQLTDAIKQELLALKPSNYLGLAAQHASASSIDLLLQELVFDQ